MAKKEVVNDLKESINKALGFEKANLISRAEWGSLNFKDATADLDIFYNLVSDLSSLPVEKLTDNLIRTIITHMEDVLVSISEIDGFNIELQENPKQDREVILSKLHSHIHPFFSNTANWIPYLVYLRGDLKESSEKIANKMRDINKQAESTLSEMQNKLEKINSIISSAKQASSTIGAAVFSKDFAEESDKMKTTAKSWLRFSIYCFLLSIVFLIHILLEIKPDLGLSETIQYVSTRIIILAVTVTAALWCGKIYKANMHQAVINRHRALSLQTFEAFKNATDDPLTKDAVLMEATRCVFSPQVTGFLESQDAGALPSTQIVEIAKQIGMAGK
ncbi:hypothetical protein ACFL5K_01855 [Gemmatimonadota bacterium]